MSTVTHCDLEGEQMQNWEDKFDEETLNIGYAMFLAGKAKKLTETTIGYTARVRDDRNYDVDMFSKAGGDIGYTCTCGNPDCAHVPAALYLLDEEVGVDKGLFGIYDDRKYDIFYDEYDDYDDFYEDGYIDNDINKIIDKNNNIQKTADKKKRNDATKPKTGDISRVFPQLADLVKSVENEMKEDSAADAKKEADTYRYFMYEHFRDNLNISKNTLKEAEKIIESGKIINEEFSTGFSDSGDDNLLCQIQASVQDRKNYRGRTNIHLVFNRTSLTYCVCDDWSCNCYYRRPDSNLKLCRHITAGILMTEEYLKKNNIGDATNYGGINLINSMLAKRDTIQHIDRDVKGQTELTLEPVAALDNDNHLSVSFRVGKDKLYKIQNLETFSDNVTDRKSMTFGKNNVMELAEDYFTGKSGEWYRFIKNFLEEDAERKERRNRDSKFGYYYQTEKKLGGNIPLYGVGLDHFFEMILGDTIEFSIPENGRKKKRMLKAQEGNISLKMELVKETDEKTGEFQGVALDGTAQEMIYGSDASYYIEGDGIFRTDKEDARRLSPLLDHMRDGRIHISIGRNHLGEFYHKVLPMLREIAWIKEFDADEIAEYIPEPPEFHTYLDMISGDIICRAEVWYGNKVHNATEYPEVFSNGIIFNEGYRDHEAEERYFEIIKRYFDKWDDELSIFFIYDSDEKTYELLQYGIDEFLDMGQVHATDAFKRLKVRDYSKFDVNISFESDLLNLDLTSDEFSPEELMEIFLGYRQKKKYFRLKNGDYFRLDENETIESLSEMMDALHISIDEFVSGHMHIPAYRALYLDKMLEKNESVYAERDRHFKELIKNFKTVEDADYDIPENLRPVLRKYQQEGYRWLRTLDSYHFGGILADEMGLGKTLEVIAVILAAKNEGKLAHPALVVCPASLVFNWEDEIRRFAPLLEAKVMAGNKNERRHILDDYLKYDVLITSYDILKRDIELYELKHFSFEILDEAQYIKNRGTAVAKSVKLINSDTRFALTGTPIENRLAELWSIFDYLMPGFLFEYSKFQKEFESLVIKQKDQQAMERLKKMTAPFILRRLKKDVLKDLPEKLEEVRVAVMEGEQQKLYDAQVLRMSKNIEGMDDELLRKSRIQILAELTKIRQICCDPSLLFEDYKGGSAKREACMELIQNAIEGEHKMLVFSQFTSMLELLEEDLNKEGIPYYKITGSTPKELRLKLVKKFNEDDTPVFLISLKAGGTGLNLTGADIVIHYDPWWNLAVQNQATDRAHRIGQKNIVTVYKLIVRGTIEEKIQHLQEQKKKLAEDVLAGEGVASATISREDLLELL